MDRMAIGKLFLKSFLKTGVDPGMDTLSRWRVLLVNWVVTVALLICLALIVINSSNGLYIHALISVIAIACLSLIFFMHQSGRYFLGSLYFINLCIVFTTAASLFAFEQNRFTETENVLYFFLLMALFLLDGGGAQVQFWFIVAMIFALKIAKGHFQDPAQNQDFGFLLVNVSVVVLALYSFSTLFMKFLKKSLNETQKQQNILYSLIDNIPLYIGIYDNKGYYTMVNLKYEGTFQMKREEIIGKRLRDIIPEKNIDVYEPMLQKALNGEEVEFHEQTEMKDGSVITANGKYIPIFDDEGNVTSVTVSLFDVTKLEAMRKELEIANQAKDRLLNIVSHDIKSPLSNFESLLRISKEKLINKEEFENYIEDLREQFSPIQQTVMELLEWSKMQMHAMTPNPEVLDLKEVVDETVKALLPNITQKKLNLEMDDQLDFLFADKTHLKIVLRNILHNAIKFTPVKGDIKFSTQASHDQGVIHIFNSGDTMAQSAIDEVMQGKVVSSTPGTKGEQGTGLGLNVCLDLVKKNNGNMEIESKESHGTTFKIRLPISGTNV